MERKRERGNWPEAGHEDIGTGHTPETGNVRETGFEPIAGHKPKTGHKPEREHEPETVHDPELGLQTGHKPDTPEKLPSYIKSRTKSENTKMNGSEGRSEAEALPAKY